MELLLRKRASIEGRKVDFIFLQDDDFRTLMLGDHKGFVNEHQHGSVAIALVGYPSFNSIISDEINFSLDQLMELYASDTQGSTGRMA